MPETVRSTLSPYKLRPRLLSNKTKIIFVTIILFASYLSGKVEFLNDIGIRGHTFREAQRNISSIAMAQSAQKEDAQTAISDAKINQIKQIAIGQKASPHEFPLVIPAKVSSNIWGVATKIDTHTYTMQVQADEIMATPVELLNALNSYRTQHGRGQLVWDDALVGFAAQRAEYFTRITGLDNHNGFLDYLNNQDGFRKLGFSNLGENSSFGFTLQAVHLIEWVYAGDDEHNNNQLNSDWLYVGIGVSGNTTDLVFGGKKR